MDNQTAFGGMLQHLVELTSIVLRSEPLDLRIERRCKQTWEEAPCPECEETAVKTREDSPRVWCSNCRYAFTYTRNTSFQDRTLTPGEVVIAFVLYADTLLSINQIAQFFDAVYDTVHTTIREMEAAFESGFHLVCAHIQDAIDSPTQIDETDKKCSGFKDRRRRGRDCLAAGQALPGDHAGKGHPEIR